MTRREFMLIVTGALGAVLLVTLFHGPLQVLDDQFTILRYSVRGERRADTNVVIVYIDQEAIKSLGWPVRRNFYALMLKALSDLHVAAVGIEAVFEDPKVEYPEYDDLLARMIAASGNVVLTSYFDSVGSPGTSVHNDSLPLPLFEFPAVLYDAPVGVHLHLPLTPIRQGAAGVGHVNIAGASDVDPFIANGPARVPAFGLEVARVFTGTARNGVVADGRRIVFRREGPPVGFTAPGGGKVGIDLPGPFSTFTTYPFLEVLRSYDALRGERMTSVPVASLRGKIVLLGVIAEGRSEFVRTYVDARYPAVALHAAFIDNVLARGFIGRTPLWLHLLVCLAAALICGIAGLALRSPVVAFVLLGLPLAVVLLSFLLFATGRTLFPVVSPIAAGFITGLTGIMYRQRRAKEQVVTLTSEKKAIMERLHDREAKVAMLEQELVNRDTARAGDRTEELLGELRMYKAEIRNLSSQADDLDVYEPGREGVARRPVEFEDIVYDGNGAMKPVVEFIRKIAASGSPVLILGESGTGKELVARAVHRRSARPAGLFVAVNCGALSESLLESELFGHEKGAFTGAIRDKPGRFELADGGTIFLDEIGEVSEGFQLKLLRVLQEREYERVGGTKTIKTNVRVVAATNKSLKNLVQEKKFREDLFYRLNVLTVSLPPLRERQDDIPPLIDHFLRREGPGMRISKNAMESLRIYPWPGNIRELESAITRGVLLAKAEQRSMITIKDLNEEIALAARGAVPVEEQVLESLRDKGFSRSSVSETADELGGLNRGTVAEYLRGESLKAFAESTFDLEKAVRRISLSTDGEVNDRVRKKFVDYLSNIATAIILSHPWEVNRSALKPKAKNLPQKYHLYLEQAGEAFYRGVWKVPSA